MAVRNIQREIDNLSQLGPSDSPALRKALADKVNLVVAKAAARIGALGMKPLIPDLCSAFDRLLRDPVRTDPQCWGKNAVAKALAALDYDESALFLKGISHTQFEPVWNGKEDTAATLRATCGLALLQTRDLIRDDKLWHIMRLLTDPAATVRKDAARALESLAGREAALLLRLKVAMGDAEPSVTGQAMESILRIEGEPAVPFVAAHLARPDEEVREESALALGASRLPGAVGALLEAHVKNTPPLPAETAFRALAVSLQPAAIDFLIQVVRTGREPAAITAIEALAPFRASVAIGKRTGEAVAGRTEAGIQTAYRRGFD